MDYQILEFRPDETVKNAWNDCLDNAEFAAHYTAPEFFDEQYFQQRKPFAVFAIEHDVVHGVLTGMIAGKVVSCGDSGSPRICIRRNSDPMAVARALAVGLKARAKGEAEFVTAFSWEKMAGFVAEGFRVRKLSVPLGTILLDLSRGSEAIFKDFSETRRNKIRRAIRAGVNVLEMDIGKDFDEYYKIYQDWCQFKKIPCEAYGTQRAVFESRGNRLILVARHEGRMIGVSTFRYRRPGIVEYAANVSRREETKVRQNDLLIWRAIEWAAAQGDLRWFSTAAAHFFLQKLGGAVHSTYRYSRDTSLLRRHVMKEVAHSAATSAYRLLPMFVRAAVKRAVTGQESSE